MHTTGWKVKLRGCGHEPHERERARPAERESRRPQAHRTGVEKGAKGKKKREGPGIPELAVSQLTIFHALRRGRHGGDDQDIPTPNS